MRPTRLLLVWIFGLGCLPAPPEPVPPVEFLGLDLSAPLEGHTPLVLGFSAPVLLHGAGPSIVRADGRRLALVELSPEPRTEWPLEPQDGWPPGERVLLEVESAFEDELGRVIEAPPAPIYLETKALERRAEVELKMPRPTERWPVNLRHLALQVAPSDTPVARLWIRAGDSAFSIEPSVHDRGRWRFRLPDWTGECASLCTDTTYELELEGPGLEVRRFSVLTTTAADHQAPTVTWAEPVRRGGTLYIDLGSDEPVIGQGVAQSDEGDRVLLLGPVLPATSARLETERPLLPEMLYHVSVEAEDLAGNRVMGPNFELPTPPAPEVEITELVLSPLHDWNDSESAGAPFDAQPGTGTVSDADQWVELVNRSTQPIVVAGSGLLLRALDQTPTETWLETAPAWHYGSGGGPDHWWPGEALVLRLRGQMSRTSLVLELLHGATLLDRVEIGSAETADHVGGRAPDLQHESVAKDGAGRFRFCEPSPGDAAPAERCLTW